MAIRDDIIRLQREVDDLKREVQAMRQRELSRAPLRLETKNE